MTPLLKGLLLFLTLILSTASFAEEVDFLDVREAFVPSLSQKSGEWALHWQIAEGYFLYRHGFSVELVNEGQGSAVAFELPEGEVKYDEFFDKEVELYHHQVAVRFQIPESKLKTDQLVVTIQGCAEQGLCYPPTSFPLKLGTYGGTVNDSPEQAPAILSSGQFLWTLAAAFVGGLILNLMPCVLPVLSLKALSLAGEGDRKEQQVHGWAYTAGVVVSFTLAGAVILLARHSGEQLGWGFQLQQPLFVAAMCYLFFTMALSLSGVLELGGAFVGVGQELTTGGHRRASFFTGVLAALVASPCTAPFMATALGVALLLPAGLALSVFVVLGVGMASPFLLLSYLPGLAKWLPKPGAWMDHFKQALAFPLYLTVIWLLWVLTNQVGQLTLFMILLGLLLIAFSAWLMRLRVRSKGGRLFTRVTSYASLGLTALLLLQTPSASSYTATPDSEQSYTWERLKDYQQQGKAVFVDLTADWCLTCKVNEQVAFTPRVKQAFEQAGVTLLVGDWTNSNPEVERLLAQHQRSGIPLYLVYPQGGGEPELLPQLLTEQLVLNAIERATKG